MTLDKWALHELWLDRKNAVTRARTSRVWRPVDVLPGDIEVAEVLVTSGLRDYDEPALYIEIVTPQGRRYSCEVGEPLNLTALVLGGTP